ncbi:MAG: PQQ-dependent sugar dehydrogenase [Solirubrobacterales bacterium]
MRARVAGTVLTLALAAFGCGDDEASTPETTATEAGGEPGGAPRLEKVGDFEMPVFVAQPPDSSDLYVVEQTGRVRLVRDGDVETALDISDDVTASGEQGLLSVAFHPREELAYVYYTDADQNQRVVEFAVGGDGAFDPDSRRELLRMEDFAPNHNGGLLLFGPDDLLYIGTGDGGGAGDPEGNGQDLGSLLGKILRIDPTASDGRPYTIPADNPFAGRSGARPEIFAYGLRNPWRFSFDPDSGLLLIADVGQDSQEEVDIVPIADAAGANFGWSAFEGTERFNPDVSAQGAIAPAFTYGREGGNCSITGGYVVRDPDLPALAGRYVYGDFCAGQLRSFVPSPSGARGDRSLGLEVPQLSSFALDGDGNVYATSLAGPVFQLVQ